MFKRMTITNRRGFFLPIVIMFLVVIILLVLAVASISYRRYLVSVHSVENNFVLTSALNLAYYDLFTGRYKGGESMNSVYYESGWSGTGPYTVTYKIPVELKPGTTGGDCSPYSLSGSSNCLSEADFAKYMRVAVTYDPGLSPQLTFKILSREPSEY